jgi:hypothetical protein
MVGVRKGVLALAVCVALGLGSGAAPAGAVTTPKKCGTITVNGKSFKVNAHIVSCEFAKRWSKHFLNRGHKPNGWSCTRYSPDETSVAFTCRKGGKDFYAVRK